MTHESRRAREVPRSESARRDHVRSLRPLIALVLLDNDMGPKNKKVLRGVGAPVAVIATLLGVSFIRPRPRNTPTT